MGVLQQLPDDLRSPPSCYSYDALELLAELLRCDEASRGLLLDQASRVGSARRAAARDLFRSSTASSFISKTLPLFVLNNAGYVSAVPEVSFSATQLQLLIPREFAVYLVSTAAASIHLTQAAAADRYPGTISPDAVYTKLLEAGYWAGSRKVGSLSRIYIAELLHTKLYCRPATGWTGSDDTGDIGAWLPRTLSLLEQSHADVSSYPCLRPWIEMIPSGWASLHTDFTKLRSFQVATDSQAMLLPKAELAGRDSLLKALEVNASCSICTRDVSLISAGVIVRRYECIRSGAPETRAEKLAAKKVAQAAAADSLTMLQKLGAKAVGTAANDLVHGLGSISAAPLPAPEPAAQKRVSRAAVVGAGPDAASQSSSPLGCSCKYRLRVYWPVVGGLALVVKSGGHSGHTLGSADDATHLGVPPIVEEMIKDSESIPGGMTVNLCQRAVQAGNRQLSYRNRAAVRRLNMWRPQEPLRGLTANSSFSSPARARGLYSGLAVSLARPDDISGIATRVLSLHTEQAQEDADRTLCGQCNVDTRSEINIVHCSQCLSVYHATCAHGNTEPVGGVASVSLEQWICLQCSSENDAHDGTGNDADGENTTTQSVVGRSPGWLPQPDGESCPGSLLTRPQAEHLFRVFKPPVLQQAQGGPDSTHDASASVASHPIPSIFDFAGALTQLPHRVSCYAHPTDPRVSTLRGSMKRASRNGNTNADDTVQNVQQLSDAGWAVVRPSIASDTSSPDSVLLGLCVVIMSPDMRAFVASETARGAQHLRTRICDATFSIGNHNLQLFGVLAIDHETGIAVPVAWFIIGKPTDTDAIAWCLEKCDEAGIPPAFITMFDKDVKEFNATAKVAASRWHSQAGRAAHQAVVEALAPLAAAATPTHITLASSVLERTPGGSLYNKRMLPPKPSQLPDFLALGALTNEQGLALRGIFKQELFEYGPVLLGLAHIMHERLTTRNVPSSADTTYHSWHSAMRHLLPFNHFVRLEGSTRRFLDDYCLIFALLCMFHVKQALTRNVLMKKGTATIAQRKQIVAEFMDFVDIAPVEGWEPIFAKYKAKWEGIVSDSWWTYLSKEWLCDEWRRLLFSSERDSFSRMYIETTNGIELVWRVFKYDWLLRKRVASYATAFRLLFGLPREPNSAFLSLTGRVLFTLMQIRNGLTRPLVRRRVQAMIDRVAPLLLRVDAEPDYLRLDPANPCWGTISATSCQFASSRTDTLPLCDAGVADKSGAVYILTEEKVKVERGRDNAAAVAAAVLHIQSIASGTAAASRSAGARHTGTEGNAQHWDQPASSHEDYAGAILPAIADSESAARRRKFMKTLLDAANTMTGAASLRRPCDAAQLDFECFRSSGRSSGRSRQELERHGEIVLQYFKQDVFDGMEAFMLRRRALTVADRAGNNVPVSSTFLNGWPMVDCVDFPGGACSSPGLDRVPRVGIVYVVLLYAAVDVWLEECIRLFVRHESR